MFYDDKVMYTKSFYHFKMTGMQFKVRILTLNTWDCDLLGFKGNNVLWCHINCEVSWRFFKLWKIIFLKNYNKKKLKEFSFFFLNIGISCWSYSQHPGFIVLMPGPKTHQLSPLITNKLWFIGRSLEVPRQTLILFGLSKEGWY